MRIVQLRSGILIILRIYYNYWQQRRREGRGKRTRWGGGGGNWHWGLSRGQRVINMKSADICHFAYCILHYAAFCGAFLPSQLSWYNCLQHVRQRVATRLLLCFASRATRTTTCTSTTTSSLSTFWLAKNQINCVPKAQLSSDQSSGRA